jgi:RND family efflux transporter MFP subunit
MDITLPAPRRSRRKWLLIAIVLLVVGAAAAWYFGNKSQDAQAAKRPAGAIPVITAKAETRDVPVRIKANGTVTALQSTDLRAQITSTVTTVHIKEGQTVHTGDLLFSLDSRTEESNIKKAQAQVEKDRADLATAQRNLTRQRELFNQKFISQAALDQVQNSVDTLTGQLAIDMASVDGSRVARAFTEIRAPFTGRTGIINVRAGSLVQPGATAIPLVTVTQIDPVTVSFTLPEKELPALQAALASGTVDVSAVPQAGGEPFKGRIVFVDNAVDTTTGTIRVKAEFANPKAALWPGMYASVILAPRTIANAVVIPAQAVQTGPDSRFVYVVGEDKKVVQKPVTLDYLEEGRAAVTGIEGNARVVVEGAQNLKPGSMVAEAERGRPLNDPSKADGNKGGKGKKAEEKPA